MIRSVKQFFILFAYMIFGVSTFAQVTFECENSFYMSEHVTLDRPDVIVTHLHKLTWQGDVLSIDTFAKYPLHFNAIAINPFDGLIYAFNAGTQEVLRLFPDGSHQNLGRPDGLLDLGFYYSAATFDELGRYVLSGYNQFISILDVSCDSAIVLNQVERTSNDISFPTSFFGDMAYHPTNGLLYGLAIPAFRLATINPNTGQVNYFGERTLQPNIGALFFDPAGNLFGYESNEFYQIDIFSGKVEILATDIETASKDGCSCLTLQPDRFHFAVTSELTSCGQAASIKTSTISALFDVIYDWSRNDSLLENESTSTITATDPGEYAVNVLVTNNCGETIHTEQHVVKIDFEEPLAFESINITNESCSQSNGQLQVKLVIPNHAAQIQVNGENLEDGTLEGLSAGSYEIVALTADDCRIATTVEITNSLCDIYVPNAFSPNNDGINDELKILSQAQASFSILNYKIFDRWGNKLYDVPVFENLLGPNWWNGFVDGQPVNSGVYVLVYSVQWPDQRVVNGQQSFTVLD